MGTISRSWKVLVQSFQLLKSDKNLLWLPVCSGIFCVCATVTIFCIGLLMAMPSGAFPHDPAQQRMLGQQMALFLFVFYVVIYTIVVFFNVALVSIASNRLGGGQATVNEGLQVAWNRKWSILQWALLAATVGVLLNLFEERLSFLGRFVASMIGLAWTLASFFVVPVLAAENMGPVEALSESADVFRSVWGEEVVGGFSFGAIFSLLAVPGILLPVLGARRGDVGTWIGIGTAVFGTLRSALADAHAGYIRRRLLSRITRQAQSASGSRDAFCS
jgi:Family of unknown function (DUF6159)